MDNCLQLLNQPGEKYLIAYDITCPKRWRRIHKLCYQNAIAIQYSLFLYSQDRKNLESLIVQLHAIADETSDDIRVYRLAQAHKWTWLGRPLMPEGVTIF